ncbi:MAG: LUD domain-containing protein [Acidimicrobiales bacterium]|nr:LUD domain-containing protein [Acidimicrobiales bacterium]
MSERPAAPGNDAAAGGAAGVPTGGAAEAASGTGREHGDRAAFLARVAARPDATPPGGPRSPHPPPPSPATVPEVAYRALDGYEGAAGLVLLPVFTEAALVAEARVHAPSPTGLPGVVAELCRVHDVRSAVVTSEPEAQALVPLLLDAGVGVSDHSLRTAAAADLGVTGAVAGVAATGSVVLDADRAGGRGAGLLPRVHLAVLPIDRLVATPSDVLRRGDRPLPSNRVLVTGPSRTGDIEQIITLGVHGPTALEILVLTDPA